MPTDAARQVAIGDPQSELIGFATEKATSNFPSLDALEVARQGLADVDKFLENAKDALLGKMRDSASWPDPYRLACREIERRSLRNKLLGEDLFSDPAWDMLLLLFSELPTRKYLLPRDFSVACGIPVTTVLRWLGALENRGLIWRREDQRDRRSINIGLTPRAVDLMTRHFAV